MLSTLRYEFECIVCQMCKYCLVSQTWKLAIQTVHYEAKQSDWGFWESLCYFCVRRLSFCQSLLFIGPCETLSSVTNTDESLTMCHNVWAKERADLCSMAHHSRGSSFCQTGLGAELWYYFATETHSHVSVWKRKASKHDQTKHYFLDVIICFQTAHRCHSAECVRKKY